MLSRKKWIFRNDRFILKQPARRRKYFLFILAIFSFAVLGLFLARTNTVSSVPPQTVPLETPLESPVPAAKELEKIEAYVKRGDTIINLLKREGLDYQSAHTFFTAIKPVYDLRKINTGNKYTLYLDKEKDNPGIERFIYEIDHDYYLEANKGEKGTNLYRAKLVSIPYSTERATISGEIEESLFAAILKTGEKPDLADMMASLYEYDIDFNRDIRKKDSFALLVEKMYLKGKFVRYGNILAAEFTNRGQSIKVIRFTDPQGKTAYYHPDGRSVRKMFLRCPLPFMRVTSHYGNRRHPLLGFSAKHNGIDLSAPRGTKVRTTASGIIFRTGRDSRKGRYISIRHNNRYISHYYHLSGIRKGIKSGVRVIQGQLIGYVGSTGWATGPHLHYGLQKNGRFMNPLRLKSPTKEPVKKIYLSSFKQYNSRIFNLLSGANSLPRPDSPMDSPILTEMRKPF
jgi:murein DD-endopeptidase MepM/ murein hydrolase activator NlpD